MRGAAQLVLGDEELRQAAVERHALREADDADVGRQHGAAEHDGGVDRDPDAEPLAAGHAAHLAQQRGLILRLNVGDREDAQRQQRDERVEDGNAHPHVAQRLGEDAGALLLNVVGRGLEAADAEQRRREAIKDVGRVVAVLRAVRVPVAGERREAVHAHPHDARHGQHGQRHEVHEEDAERHAGRLADANQRQQRKAAEHHHRANVALRRVREERRCRIAATAAATHDHGSGGGGIEPARADGTGHHGRHGRVVAADGVDGEDGVVDGLGARDDGRRHVRQQRQARGQRGDDLGRRVEQHVVGAAVERQRRADLGVDGAEQVQQRDHERQRNGRQLAGRQRADASDVEARRRDVVAGDGGRRQLPELVVLGRLGLGRRVRRLQLPLLVCCTATTTTTERRRAQAAAGVAPALLVVERRVVEQRRVLAELQHAHRCRVGDRVPLDRAPAGERPRIAHQALTVLAIDLAHVVAVDRRTHWRRRAHGAAGRRARRRRRAQRRRVARVHLREARRLVRQRAQRRGRASVIVAVLHVDAREDVPCRRHGGVSRASCDGERESESESGGGARGEVQRREALRRFRTRIRNRKRVVVVLSPPCANATAMSRQIFKVRAAAAADRGAEAHC